MEQQEYYKAGIYCRLSQDDGQSGDSSSIQTQKMMLGKYAREQGFNIHDFYVDDGYSGLNFNRPDFQKLLNDIENGKINLVITKDLSRLGRDYIQTGYYTEIYFPNKNVRYIAVNDNVDTIKADNDIAPFKNILNDMYARDLSRKVKSAKRQRMYQGYFICGQTPYGYKKDPNNHNKLIIDEEAAEVVREIFRMAIAGSGTKKIVNELTGRNILMPSAYKAKNGDTRFTRYEKWQKENPTWCLATVMKILHDRVYAGDMENGKYAIPNYKTKKRVKVPKEKHIIVENTHEPIISREDFNRVQDLMSARYSPVRHNYTNIFKSIVYCGECGKRLTLAAQKGKTFYRCMNHFINPDQCKHNHQIHHDTLYEIIFERLKRAFRELEKSGDMLANLSRKAAMNGKSDKLIIEKTKIEKRITALTKITRKLYEDNATEMLDDYSYQQFLKEYQREQKSLNERLTVISKELNSENNHAANFQKLKDLTTNFLDFTELTPNMLHQLIDKIEVGSPDKKHWERRQEINIVYRFIGTTIS